MGEPHAGTVLQVGIAATIFRSGVDAPRDMDDDVTLTLLSQRLMTLEDSDVEATDRVSVLKTAVDDTVDHGFPPECTNMLRDIVSRTNIDVFRPAILGDLPARMQHMIVRFQPDAGGVRAKPPSNSDHLPLNTAFLPRPPVGGNDDRGRSCLGRVEGGGEHQGAGVERVSIKPRMYCERAQGAAAEGEDGMH